MATSKLAKGLGWFSIGLGALEVIAPGALERMLGVKNSKSLVRLYGAREIAVGTQLLAVPGRKAPWLWGRVAGDALDLATIAFAFRSKEHKTGGILTALASVAGVTALDVYAAATV